MYDLKLEQVVRTELGPWHEAVDKRFDQLNGKIITLRKDCKLDQMNKVI